MKPDNKKNKNQENWELLFEKLDVLKHIESQGYFVITSKQINEYRESRLMTKFDHKNNLPEIFSNNNLSILPLSRGSYIIGKFDAYKDISYSKDVETIFIQKRNDLETINYDNIYSESIALNYAYATGIISNILGEDSVLTISGRMSSKDFEFFIQKNKDNTKKKITVQNSQCEIDAGFESENKLALIEAKNTKCDDFLIRQLYYPYRLWKNKISKEIVPIFMTFSNDKFSFFIYQFENEEDYNSLKLIQQKDFIVTHEPITLEDIKMVVNNIKFISEPNVPFPQADSFIRIIDLLNLLIEENLSKEYITSNYDFDPRQTDYYFNGAKYLDLAYKIKDEENNVVFSLTKKGKRIMSKEYRNKNLTLIDLILQHKIFYDVLNLYMKYSKPPTKEKIVEIMKKNEIYKVESDKTYFRRATTVLRWVEWILELSEE